MNTKILPWSKPNFLSLPQCDCETDSPARSGRCKRVAKTRLTFDNGKKKNLCSSHTRFKRFVEIYGEVVDKEPIYVYVRRQYEGH